MDFEAFIKERFAEKGITVDNLAQIMGMSSDKMAHALRMAGMGYEQIANILNLLGYKLEIVEQ